MNELDKLATDHTIALYQSISAHDKPRVFDAWHPSSLSNCPRSHYLRRLGVAAISKPTAAKMLRWQTGHSVENAIRPHLINLYPTLITNRKLEDKEMNLAGEVDGYDIKTQTLVEVKSVSARAVKYKKVSDTRYHLRDEKPYLHHEYQTHAYVHLLGKTGMPVKRIEYFYITLEGLIVSYLTEVRPEITAEIMGRLEQLNEAWKTQTPPACICLIKDHPLEFIHRYCDYRNGDECCEVTAKVKKEAKSA